MFWSGSQLLPVWARDPASVPPLVEGRSSPSANSPVYPSSSFVLLSFALLVYCFPLVRRSCPPDRVLDTFLSKGIPDISMERDVLHGYLLPPILSSSLSSEMVDRTVSLVSLYLRLLFLGALGVVLGLSCPEIMVKAGRGGLREGTEM